MVTIHIVACCPVEQNEIEVATLEQAMCAIEESIALLLHDMFDVVLVEKVSIQYSSTEEACGDLQAHAA